MARGSNKAPNGKSIASSPAGGGSGRRLGGGRAVLRKRAARPSHGAVLALAAPANAERELDRDQSFLPPHKDFQRSATSARDDEAAIELRHRIQRPTHR